MTNTDPIVDLGALDPVEALDIVRKTRGLTIYLHTEVQLPSSEGRVYPYLLSTVLTRQQALKALQEIAGFRQRKAQQDPETPPADLPKISVHRSNNCLFIG